MVNEHRSAVLRQHWLGTLEALLQTATEDDDEEPRPALVKRAFQEILQVGPTNTFENVFDACVTVGTDGLRLKFCDKADVSSSADDNSRMKLAPTTAGYFQSAF